MQEDIRTPEDVIDKLGAEEIATALAVDVRTVTNKTTGRTGRLLPAWWFVACREIAAAKGMRVSEDAFAFARKSPDRKAS